MRPYVLLFATYFLQGPSVTACGPSYHKNQCTNIQFIKFKYSIVIKKRFYKQKKVMLFFIQEKHFLLWGERLHMKKTVMRDENLYLKNLTKLASERPRQ